MSIRTALIGTMLLVGAAATGLLGIGGVVIIGNHVEDVEQERVNFDLKLARSQFDQQLRLVADRVQLVAKNLEAAGGAELTGAELSQIPTVFPDGRSTDIRSDSSLTVLNVCDTEGKPLAGTYPSRSAVVPIKEDPILQDALAGKSSWGTVLLDKSRIELEGGQSLASAVLIAGPTPDSPHSAFGATEAALFWWVACPIQDRDGTIRAIVYGGQPLNNNLALVDKLRELSFGLQTYKGKPRGTVTIFQHGVRVATNVVGPTGTRAIGTTVSEEVQQHVLVEGNVWQDRAWVVDAWYLSAYEPILDLQGQPIGMLYVGLLESPYSDLRKSWLGQLALVLLLISAVAIGFTVFVVRRITAPLDQLVEASEQMTVGKSDKEWSFAKTYSEVKQLTEAFQVMQRAIAQRDADLREQNAELAVTNEKLSEANYNYMESLGFVTHELKAPLAAMQNMIDVVSKGYAGEIPDKASGFLDRVRRSCLEMREMVKNYLDLSRAERGELDPQIAEVELVADVLQPAIEQTRDLFDLRAIRVELNCPKSVPLTTDAEMLRIAMVNLLSNASKYGRQDGSTQVNVLVDGDLVSIAVRNDGQGFTAAERDLLFQKFSRLANANTRGQRGSGLGLFLCRKIAKALGGDMQANSEPGEWAEFTIKVSKL